ncbi:MAG: hypothetical protein ACO3DK_02125 [Bacteroidia bacterium]
MKPSFRFIWIWALAASLALGACSSSKACSPKRKKYFHSDFLKM